ncbi:unnamed protein product [Phytophthora fragariaefolia]|uniref:Unnamed protein product n=1 Tax=Phytophthora fragariaefolia TaxID=1490495 RepID=A0A9W7D383_9STRA|nr:unnamed protein product [Phytophthora fragariaefolia]
MNCCSNEGTQCSTVSAFSNLQFAKPAHSIPYNQARSAMQVLALIATGAAILTSIPTVHGHGYIVDPAAQWTQGYPSNGYGSTIDNAIWGAVDGSKYGYGPSGAISYFKANFPTKGGGSLDSFIATNQKLYSSDVDPECGLTTFKDSVRSKLPSSALEYTGFTHPGPCEIAMHGSPWQVYTDCVWLEGGSGKGAAPTSAGEGGSKVAGGSASNTTTTETSPSTSTATTAPSTSMTSGPSTSTTSESEEVGNEASCSIDANTSYSNYASPASGSKCARRRH